MIEKPISIVAGVTGWPVHHSLSPVLHTHWLQQLKINGAYTMFAVHPDEAVYAFKSLVNTTIAGVNVTIPLKEKAYEAADELTPEARALGVCNLLYTRGNKLIGHNTDMEGFSEPLIRQVGRNYLENHSVTLIGAGGASRAVIGALLNLGVPEIRLLNRTDQRALDLARQVQSNTIKLYSWENRQNAIAGTGLIINASSAGMHGMPALDVDVSSAAKNAWVYDLVYTPRKTPLIKQALQHGLKTIGGLDMLIAQARPSFHALYGEHAPIDKQAKQVLIKALGKR